MSYTPPAANAVDFTFAGQPSYTAPGTTAVDFSFDPVALLKYWNGSAWITKPLKIWNGSAWVNVPRSKLKRWNGTAWV